MKRIFCVSFHYKQAKQIETYGGGRMDITEARTAVPVFFVWKFFSSLAKVKQTQCIKQMKGKWVLIKITFKWILPHFYVSQKSRVDSLLLIHIRERAH